MLENFIVPTVSSVVFAVIGYFARKYVVVRRSKARDKQLTNFFRFGPGKIFIVIGREIRTQGASPVVSSSDYSSAQVIAASLDRAGYNDPELRVEHIFVDELQRGDTLASDAENSAPYSPARRDPRVSRGLGRPNEALLHGPSTGRNRPGRDRSVKLPEQSKGR